MVFYYKFNFYCEIKRISYNLALIFSQLCFPGSLDPEKVKGKIVFCLRGDNARVEKGEVVLQAGGVGMILGNDPLSGNELIADAHVLPATHITATDAKEVLDYIATTE